MENYLQNSRPQSPVFSNVGIDPGIEELQVSSPTEYRTLSMSMRELVETFPQKKTIKALIKEDEVALRDLKEIENKVANDLFRAVNISDADFCKALIMAVINGDFIEHKSRNKTFKEGESRTERLARNKSLLRLIDMPKENRADFGTKIARAKLYPIESLVALGRDNGAKCPLPNHKEKTASFKVNKKTNKWRCFGCSEHGDAIDLYMKLNGCDFKTAVEKLC